MLLLLLAFSAWAKETQIVPPESPDIRYVGRFTNDFRFGWTGSMVETDFNGTEISAIMDLVQGQKAALTVVIDGEETFVPITSGQRIYPLASELPSGKMHHIALFKRSEGCTGTLRFGGFEASVDGSFASPLPRSRKILAIGDSITCGYGNEAATSKEGNTIENQNGYMSYAAIAARDLDADLMMVCWSGKGLYRNLDRTNDRVAALPDLFEQTLPMSKDETWNHHRFIPDVISINLGTNDMGRLGNKEPLKQEDYERAYAKFITRLRSFAPNAKIIISIGPMTNEPVATWLPKIAAQFKNVSVLIYPPYAERDESAGHGHPSVKKDLMMARRLEGQIREMTGWE